MGHERNWAGTEPHAIAPRPVVSEGQRTNLLNNDTVTVDSVTSRSTSAPSGWASIPAISGVTTLRSLPILSGPAYPYGGRADKPESHPRLLLGKASTCCRQRQSSGPFGSVITLLNVQALEGFKPAGIDLLGRYRDGFPPEYLH
jgi:hypothetical protein